MATYDEVAEYGPRQLYVAGVSAALLSAHAANGRLVFHITQSDFLCSYLVIERNDGKPLASGIKRYVGNLDKMVSPFKYGQQDALTLVERLEERDMPPERVAEILRKV